MGLLAWTGDRMTGGECGSGLERGEVLTAEGSGIFWGDIWGGGRWKDMEREVGWDSFGDAG